MDYEKKYKELIEKIESISHSALTVEQHQIIDTILGELKESEDERIRKELITWLKNSEGQTMPIDRYNAALDWLEKQDPKKHEEELEKAYKTADKVQYRRGYEDATKEMEKQGESYTKRDVDNAWLEGMCDAKRELEKQGEQKPKWTDEDEERLQSCIIALQGKGLMGGVDTMDSKWLKSLKQRIG